MIYGLAFLHELKLSTLLIVFSTNCCLDEYVNLLLILVPPWPFHEASLGHDDALFCAPTSLIQENEVRAISFVLLFNLAELLQDSPFAQIAVGWFLSLYCMVIIHLDFDLCYCLFMLFIYR